MRVTILISPQQNPEDNHEHPQERDNHDKIHEPLSEAFPIPIRHGGTTSRLTRNDDDGLMGDELRALLALGIIASVAVVWGLFSTGNFPLTFVKPPRAFHLAELGMEFLVVGVFSLYILVLTIAMGFGRSRWSLFRWISGGARKRADTVFEIGALLLIALLLLLVARVIVWHPNFLSSLI